MTKGLPDYFLHKNRLQEYAQKSGLNLPVYQISSEGFPHALMFKAAVRVNQTTYTSPLTFPHRKEAEQNVAKVALQTIKQTSASAITNKDKQLSISLIYKDPKYCKSILNEFAFRMNKTSPKYTTITQNRMHPIYVSSVVFDGKTYRGEVRGSIKDAEQLAAWIAIESLLDSDSGNLLQIINSKGKGHSGNNINQTNTQRPALVGSSPQTVIDDVGPSASSNAHAHAHAHAHDDNKKRKLQGENWHQKQMRIRQQ